MDIIFFGTPQISLPILSTLYERYTVKLIVTKTDKPQSRGQKIIFSATKEFALKHNIPIFQPSKLKNNENAYELIKKIRPDFLVIVAYGLILPENILNIPKYAPINVHFSLLPKYRGAAPVNWAIIKGEKYTGVTTMFMNSTLDGGDILLQSSTLVDKKDAPTLSNELASLGSKLIVKTIDSFPHIKRKKQNESKVSYAPILRKEDGLINWEDSAIQIERKIRGLLNWPTAYSYLHDKLVKFYAAEAFDHSLDKSNYNRPGVICKINDRNFYITTGEGILAIQKLQMEGKKILSAADFIRGNRIKEGDSFSSEKH
jgi:methionyl-tRNA formyltransferase